VLIEKSKVLQKEIIAQGRVCIRAYDSNYLLIIIFACRTRNIIRMHNITTGGSLAQLVMSLVASTKLINAGPG